MQGVNGMLGRATPAWAAVLLTLGISTAPRAAGQAAAPAPAGDPKATEQWTPVPPVVTPGATPGSPPSDAIVLFDGKNLDEWVSAQDHSPARWTLADGTLTVNKAVGNIETKRTFRNYQLHLEWRIPKDITGEGQLRGNSGVFLASTGAGDAGYELQIMDSYHNPTYVNGQAASIYKQSPPLVNAMKKPGEWQVYDVVLDGAQLRRRWQRLEPRLCHGVSQRRAGPESFQARGRDGLHRQARVPPLRPRRHQAAGAWRSIRADQLSEHLGAGAQGQGLKADPPWSVSFLRA